MRPPRESFLYAALAAQGEEYRGGRALARHGARLWRRILYGRRSPPGSQSALRENVLVQVVLLVLMCVALVALAIPWGIYEVAVWMRKRSDRAGRRT